eukprot:3939794-Rhodomonas_salina.1
MKMRKRTVLGSSRVVFRGLSVRRFHPWLVELQESDALWCAWLPQNGELPQRWLLENLMGSKGGVEVAFMSTSFELAEAAKYASKGSNPIVLQIELAQVGGGCL